MRPHRNSSIHGRTKRADPAEKLQHKPQSQNHDSGHTDQEDEDQGQDPVTRFEDNVRTQHAGNRSARAQRRDMRIQVERDVHQARSHSANEVKEQIAQVAKGRFDVVAEDPQEQHIAQDVSNARVEKHAGQQRQECRFETSATA